MGRQGQTGPREVTSINPTGGYLVHIVVPSHARVAECLVEGHWEVWGVEASTREAEGSNRYFWGIQTGNFPNRLVSGLCNAPPSDPQS